MRRIAAIALAAGFTFATFAAGPVEARSDTRLWAAQEAFQAGQYDAAISRFSDIISAGKYGKTTLAQAFYYRGIAFQRAGKAIEALADYTNALWLEGLSKKASAQCLIRRGYLRLELKQMDTALEDMNTALRTHPDAEGYMARARVLTVSGDTGAAMKDLAAAEKLNPNRKWFFHMVRAETLEAMGRRGEARAEARRAVELNPNRDFAPTRQLLARLGGAGTQLANVPAAKQNGLVTGSISRKAKQRAGTPQNDWMRATSVHRAEPPVPVRAAKPPLRRAAHPASAAGKGGYVVQLAASRDLQAAKRAVHRLAKKNNALLSGHDLFVVKGLGKGSQDIFRIRMGPFASRTEPDSICAQLKARGQDCFVTRR